MLQRDKQGRLQAPTPRSPSSGSPMHKNEDYTSTSTRTKTRTNGQRRIRTGTDLEGGVQVQGSAYSPPLSSGGVMDKADRWLGSQDVGELADSENMLDWGSLSASLGGTGGLDLSQAILFTNDFNIITSQVSMREK